jgi:hypothetical protein
VSADRRSSGRPGQDSAAGKSSLRADCGRCFGLCCVAPAFSASADFAIDKPAGQACPNLAADFGCSVHDRLRPLGFPGCTVFDCFGAGQKVAQDTFGGRDWRHAPEIAGQMFQVFGTMRQLHELLWYLSEALTLVEPLTSAAAPARPGPKAPNAAPARGETRGRLSARELHDELSRAVAETERLTCGSRAALAELDVTAHRTDANAMLVRTSELVRAQASRPESGRQESSQQEAGRRRAGRQEAGLRGRRAARPRATRPPAADYRGADLIGQDLRDADLRCANLRGAYLIGARLQGADLAVADLTGADLRGADLSGADLSASIFVTQAQIDAATGDPGTRLPPSLTRPAHWPG